VRSTPKMLVALQQMLVRQRKNYPDAQAIRAFRRSRLDGEAGVESTATPGEKAESMTAAGSPRTVEAEGRPRH
jgi:hypothetical protein